MRGSRASGLTAIAVALIGLVLATGASASRVTTGEGARTPIVLFPAYHFTRLLVTVHDQRVDFTFPSTPENALSSSLMLLSAPRAT